MLSGLKHPPFAADRKSIVIVNAIESSNIRQLSQAVVSTGDAATIAAPNTQEDRYEPQASSGEKFLYSRRDILDPVVGQDAKAEEEQVRQLCDRDREVRVHEGAHLAILGGNAVGGASFTYQIGPDGRAYAVGGSVTADLTGAVGPGGDASKSAIIRAAALAGANPSAADAMVAARVAQR